MKSSTDGTDRGQGSSDFCRASFVRWMEDEPVRPLTRVIGCTAAAFLAVAACGTSNASTESASRPSRPGVFPLTMTRTGGIAGFQDVVVVAGDGLVSVTRREQKQGDCRLTSVAVKRVRTAASQVPWARLLPDGGQARFPDDMVVMVRSPAGGPVRLEDLKVGISGKVFQSLLDDLLGRPAASSMCKAEA